MNKTIKYDQYTRDTCCFVWPWEDRCFRIPCHDSSGFIVLNHLPCGRGIGDRRHSSDFCTIWTVERLTQHLLSFYNSACGITDSVPLCVLTLVLKHHHSPRKKKDTAIAEWFRMAAQIGKLIPNGEDFSSWSTMCFFSESNFAAVQSGTAQRNYYVFRIESLISNFKNLDSQLANFTLFKTVKLVSRNSPKWDFKSKN